MIYLLLSILSSALIIVLFKLFDIYNVKTLHAIIINYWVAAGLSFALDDSGLVLNQAFVQPWFINSILMGVLFISLFNVIAISTAKIGVSVTSVANKMSLIMPVLFAIIFLEDKVNAIKIIGILLALLAVYFTAKKSNDKTVDSKYVAYPFIVFVGSGFIDTFFKYNDEFTLGENGLKPFLSWIFLTAGSIGLIALIVEKFKNKQAPNVKALIGGVILGIPNYFSVFFLLKSLSISTLESSVVFPINNMAIVAVTAMAGIFLFKEKMSKINIFGICLCIAAIGMIAFSEEMMILF
jgi:drug/metabolite transporter (DMT)-like permease